MVSSETAEREFRLAQAQEGLWVIRDAETREVIGGVMQTDHDGWRAWFGAWELHCHEKTVRWNAVFYADGPTVQEAARALKALCPSYDKRKRYGHGLN